MKQSTKWSVKARFKEISFLDSYTTDSTYGSVMYDAIMRMLGIDEIGERKAQILSLALDRSGILISAGMFTCQSSMP